MTGALEKDKNQLLEGASVIKNKDFALFLIGWFFFKGATILEGYFFDKSGFINSEIKFEECFAWFFDAETTLFFLVFFIIYYLLIRRFNIGFCQKALSCIIFGVTFPIFIIPYSDYILTNINNSIFLLFYF